jgi:pimeloyl-ACP methyl ester carboxylesterase
MESQHVEVEGLPVHLFSAGEGPPLVYLHGVAPAGEWLPLHDRLARGRRVYAPDHPGFGRTERPDWLEGIEDIVLLYEGLFRRLEIERPVLVGFSLGGWIAAHYAVTYPDRVGALVLLNAAGLHVEGALIPDLAAMDRETLARTVFHDPAAAEAYFGARSGPEDRLRTFRALTTMALLAWNPWFDPRLPRRLARVEAPALALWAEHDRLIPPVYGEAYRDALPDCRLEVLPDCGHMAPIERPEAVAEAIERFLAGV